MKAEEQGHRNSHSEPEGTECNTDNTCHGVTVKESNDSFRTALHVGSLPFVSLFLDAFSPSFQAMSTQWVRQSRTAYLLVLASSLWEKGAPLALAGEGEGTSALGSCIWFGVLSTSSAASAGGTQPSAQALDLSSLLRAWSTGTLQLLPAGGAGSAHTAMGQVTCFSLSPGKPSLLHLSFPIFHTMSPPGVKLSLLTQDLSTASLALLTTPCPLWAGSCSPDTHAAQSFLPQN